MRKIARRTADITTSHFGAKAICLQLVALASALWANIKWVPNVRLFPIHGYQF